MATCRKCGATAKGRKSGGKFCPRHGDLPLPIGHGIPINQTFDPDYVVASLSVAGVPASHALTHEHKEQTV